MVAAAGAVVAAGVVVNLPRAATAAATVDPGAWYVLVARHSGKALDVYNRSTVDGGQIVQWARHDGAWQQWQFVDAGGGWYRLRSRHSGKVLDVHGFSTANGANLVQWTDLNGTNQQFRLTDTSDGHVSLVNRNSGLAVEVTGASTADGARVTQRTPGSATNQQWRLVRLGGGTPVDTTPPTAPGSPRTSGLTCTSVTLSWTAASDDVGVSAYDIYHDGQFMTSVPGSVLTTTLTVVPGAVWGLYVNARDAAGNVSQASPTTSITVPQCQADTVAPSTPTGLRTAVSGTTVTLTWQPATDDVGVTGYEILRDGALVGTSTSTSFLDSGLAPATTHRYQVRARDAQGNRSTASAAVTATTAAACANPVCEVTEVATETDIPWGLVTLPDGTVLYGRRDVHDIARLDPATGTKTSVGTVPNADGTDGEGGVMGLEISPTFATDRWVYAMHTSPTDNRIVRIRYGTDNRLDPASLQVLLTGILRNKFHNGGRLRWGPDGKLYAATGDGQDTRTPQDTTKLAGKVLRINPDGSIPADNPFGNAVWSYGHRNPQGLAFDTQGRLWEQEFGNSVMDETNLIVKGGNYGWPNCEGTHSHSGTGCATPGYIAPKHTYSVAAGSCSGIAVVRDALYIACARGARMYRAVITGTSLTDVRQYFVGTYGRLRTVEPAPGNGLWLTTTNRGDKDQIPNNSNERILRVQLGT